tara:strand:+ start:58 stop:603 length:546 start_codon:yes stop_codon:yes gene_type:complete
MRDGTGREFDDNLTTFLEWYIDAGERINTPLNRSIHFVENLTSLCIYRHEPFQVELVTVKPNTYIPPHTHPNVDSYEVALRGIEFYSDGKTVLPMWFANQKDPNSNLSIAHYNVVRVLPSSEHSAKAGPEGGCFLSVQQWLNGVEPSAVGMDWKGGSSMGNGHDSQITSTEEANEGDRTTV